MKDVFDLITKNLPQPLLFGLLAVAAIYFAIYYHYSYETPAEAFRDTKFRNIAIIIIAASLLKLVNRPSSSLTDSGFTPVLLVPKFAYDAKDSCRSALLAMIETKLDQTLGRPRTVETIQSFVTDSRSAELLLDEHSASAIIYDASVSSTGADQVICYRVLTKADGYLPRFPPLPIKAPESQIDQLVVSLAGEVLKNSPSQSRNPLLARLDELERRMENLSMAAIANSPTHNQLKLPVYGMREAVVIGVDQFEGSDHTLLASENDAKEMSEVLSTFYGFNVKSLLGNEATKSQILEVVSKTLVGMGPDDIFVLYYAGNGVQVPVKPNSETRVGGLVPYDFKWETNHLTTPSLIEILGGSPASCLLVIDACHAASAGTSISPSGTFQNVELLASTGPDQFANETANGGVFSQALFQVLRDSAKRSIGLPTPEVLSKIRAIMAPEFKLQAPELVRSSGTRTIAFIPTVAGATQN